MALNAVLLAVAPLPSLFFMWWLVSGDGSCWGEWSLYVPPWLAALGDHRPEATWVGPQQVCRWATEHPLALLNVLYFLNVDVLFWLISLFQGSTWLIDPYWTIIPVLIGHFFAAHPAAAAADPLRSTVALALLWVWSIRLTHSYFRREEWRLGAREDWRFNQMRKSFGFLWPLLSFFLVYLSQHVLLIGISLPLYSIHFPTLSPLPASCAPADVLGLRTLFANVTTPAAAAAAAAATPVPPAPAFNYVWDSLIVIFALSGIVVAYFADTQLHHYMIANEQREKEGKPKKMLLDTGLWYYSRHPNYFGEQLWWWALSCFSVYLGQWYMIAGTFINSLCLAVVASMVEKRMLDKPERREIFREYQRTTSVLVPWFKGSSFKAKEN